MATLRIGNRTAKGIFKDVVLDIGKKVKIGIGYVDGTALEQSIFTTLERLESAIIRGEEPNVDLKKRVGKLPQRIQTKLLKKKLIVQQEEGPTLAQVRDEFASEKLITGDPRTVRNYKNALNKGLLTFVDQDRKIETVTEEDVVKFIRESSKKYADSTVKGQIKRGKALFQFAVDEGYVTDNPFDAKKVRELSSSYSIKLAPDREQTQTENMTPAEIDRLLHCKKSERSDIEDREWNALIWLLRFGGNRVSSYLVLRWQDINFETAQIQLRMKQVGRKRKFIVGNKRIETMPLFPELVEPLLHLKAMQPEGTEYVLNKIGNLDQKPEFETTNAIGERIKQGRWETNLSTTFKKILKRNGFKVWSQPFHAFRSYRGAELDRRGASAIELNAWIGNSEEVRKRHYGKFHIASRERLAELSGQTA